MARPTKAGVDYFPHDTDASSRKTIFTLESLFGNDGYAFWFKLLETLGTQEGLFFDCNKTPDWLFLIAKMRVSSDTATEILNTLAKIEAIDPELWDKKIIWVQNFADRLKDVYKKRAADIPQKPSFRSENNSFRSENLKNNDVSEAIMPQIKGKETKTEERITTPPIPQGSSGVPDLSIQEKRFDEFWAVYPRKVGKQAAFKAWQRVKPTAELHGKIMGAVMAATKTKQWQRENGRYIPNPATWLNEGRWDDEYKEANTNGEYRSIAGTNGQEPAGPKPRKPDTVAPGFKFAGESDDEHEQTRPALSGFHMAE